jgi:transcriptional regulator with XRE-family HTH domain
MKATDVVRYLQIAAHDKGVSQQTIAAHTGLSKAYVSQMLGGRRMMNLDRYLRICEAIRIPPAVPFNVKRHT